MSFTRKPSSEQPGRKPGHRSTMSSSNEPQVLNSNPEVLLRKRRNADRTRNDRQAEIQKRRETRSKQRKLNKKRFLRAESIVAKTLATDRENERIKRISKLEAQKSKSQLDHLPSDKNFLLKITERGDYAEDDHDEDDDGLIKEKSVYNGEPTLLFVMRVKTNGATSIPHRAFKILTLLRLVELNTGIFIKLTGKVYPLLKFIAPYIVIGKPSLSSIRALIQKRSRISYQKSEDEEPVEMPLNDNNIIEEKLGELGIICQEDIVHEISVLGDSFKKCSNFLLPFKLNREISGFSAINKVRRIKQRENAKRTQKYMTNSSTAPIIEVDINSLIAKLN
ncbi:hypothetical protein HG535_0B04270 [Zygotorulaspora mrakii]|uniref:Uncharacterized protein n=1 Tax=Zygotorulaspora mrakii TaxID=42260 RepID=A0A7H9AYA7_ZYGMR|nr:uncharacterized protein HG535_0B04270 [Zygotorulaspora mrakii]QLG71385.1 hypothetical protein HG535_0B04270 [Zygotorulaspora mrakii]